MTLRILLDKILSWCDITCNIVQNTITSADVK